MKIITSLLISALLCSAVATHAQTPVLDWARQFGGTVAAWGTSIAVDASGNVYTTGKFWGTVDFDPEPGTYYLTAATSTTYTFVSKLDASGNFVWAKAFGGTTSGNQVIGGSIAVDASGNVYTTGSLLGTADFDPGTGIYNLTSPSGVNCAFVSKLDAVGNFVWAKSFASTNLVAFGNGIAVDASGNVYTTGYFSGTVDFDPGPSTYNLVCVGTYDIFISKLDGSGNFIWAKRIGNTSQYNSGNDITVDASANVYVTGQLEGTNIDFDPGPGIVNLSSNGNTDIFVLKMSTAGILIWAKNMGGTSAEYGNSITVDASGNVYTTGPFAGTADFDPGASTYNLISAGSNDIFVSKLNSNGAFVWAKSMGGTGNDNVDEIAIDGSHNVYTTGYFNLTADFDPDNSGIYNLTSTGGMDIFISKLDVNGAFAWAIKLGGTNSDNGNSISVDSISNIYTTGRFTGPVDFDPGPGTDTLNSFGSYDAFVLKLKQCVSSSSSITVSVCDSYTAPDAQVYTTSGVKTAVIPNHAGCDSTITINLTIKHSTLSIISPVVCNSYTSPSGHHTWTVSNTYTDSIANHAGCDSIMTINLTVNHNTTATISPAVCNSYKSPSGHYTWTVSNTYMDTIANHAGCDSVLTINLTILTADVLVTNNSPTLVAHATGASYQWINCNTGFAPIAGQTGQSFTAVANGDYAVIVSQNGCTDTSACYNVYNVGILENGSVIDVRVYPNPANEKLIIESPLIRNEAIIKVYDVRGQLLLQQIIQNDKTEMDISSLAGGVYLVRVLGADINVVRRIIKE